MAFFDRVRVAVASTGPGPVALGAAVPGFRSFVEAGVPDNASVSYVIEDTEGAYELGVGTYDADTNTLARTTVMASSNAGAPLDLSPAASLFLSPMARDLKRVITSGGAADAGSGVALNAAGQLDPSLLTGSKGYANLPQLVLSAGNYAPPQDASAATYAPFQVVVSYADATQGEAGQTTVFGNHRKPAILSYVKTRATDPYDFYNGRLLSNDGIIAHTYQGASGNGQSAHVGYDVVIVDGDPQPGALGEFPGAFLWMTGTGIQNGVNPGYFGVQEAFRLNSKQQALFAGRVLARQAIAGTNAYPEPGADFGATVKIGPGGPYPGEAPLKFDAAHSVLLTLPEPYAEEVDATGARYTTRADAVRRRYVTADPASPTIAVGAGAGTGATATITWSPDGGGRITIVMGSSPDATAPVATVTMAHAYPNAIYPMLSPANNRVPGLASNYYTTDNGTNFGSFLLYLPTAAAGKTYVFNFTVTGG